ncbi:MAG: hypothetical protein Q9174_002696 [Haloplaca sp. 1 TL-2023]
MASHHDRQAELASEEQEDPGPLASPLDHRPTQQLLADLDAHARGERSPPSTPGTTRRLWSSFNRRIGRRSSSSRLSPTAGPTAGSSLTRVGTSIRAPEPSSLEDMDTRFLAPAPAGVAMVSKQKERTMQMAQEQEQALAARLQKDNLEMPPFKFLELIGKGAFGRVFKAHDLERHKEVALKVVDVDPHDFKVHHLEKDESISTVMHEIKVLTQLRDSGAKNINLIIDAFPIHSQLWIVTEYCPGGSLHTLMQGVGSKLEEKYIIPVARELAIALKAIHAAGIIHRDVKAANVMIHEKGALQLIDFGVAGLLQTSKDKRSTIIGTPHWMAPEISSQLVNQGPSNLDYATEVDVWAYGCTLYEIATGNPPYHRMGPGRQLTAMLKRSQPRLNEKDFSHGLVDLMQCIMQSVPEKRPSMAEILQHPYLANTEEEYPTRSLADLVKKYYGWECMGGQRSSLFMPGGAEAAAFPTIGDDDDEEWNFSTTMNFDHQNSAAYLAAPQHPASASNISHDTESDTSHRAGLVSSRSTTSLHPHSALHKPTSSLDFNFSMADSPDVDIPTAPAGAKDQPQINTSDTAGPPSAATKGNVERGEKSLQAIFDQSAPDYQYGADSKFDDAKTPTATLKAENTKPPLDRSKSDLPLRNATSGLAVHKEVDKSGMMKTPSIDLANVNTIKANRINSRSGTSLAKQGADELEAAQKGGFDSTKRATMEWSFATAQETPDTEVTMPARPNNRGTLDWSFATAGTVEDDENDETAPPVRPGLGRMATQPVGIMDPRPKSVLDLDELYESEITYDSSTAPASEDEGFSAYDLTDAQEPMTEAPDSSVYPDLSHAHPQSSLCAPAKLKMRMLEAMVYKYDVDAVLAESIIIRDGSDPFDLTHGNEELAEALVDEFIAKEHSNRPFHLNRAMKRDIMDARIDVFSEFLRGDYPFEDYITVYDNEKLGEPYHSSGEESSDGSYDEEEAEDDEAGQEGGSPEQPNLDMKAMAPGATRQELKEEFDKHIGHLGKVMLPWASRRLEEIGEEEAGEDEGRGGMDMSHLDINEGEEGGDEA